MSEPVWECFVCGKPVSDETAHFCHAENCGFKETGSCECDFPCHPKCCPDCNPIDKEKSQCLTPPPRSPTCSLQS